jgi:hypothetical protein
LFPRFGVSDTLEAFESLAAVGIMALSKEKKIVITYFIICVASHTDVFNGHYHIKSWIIMVKKNLNTPPASSSRGHRYSRGSGRPPGRGFTGHKGRGSPRDYTGHGPIGVEERPESAVDEPSDGDDQEGSTECTRLGSSIVLYSPDIILAEETDDVEIDVPIAMWVSLF